MSALTETPGGDPLDREIDAAQFSDEGVAGLTIDWSVPWSDLMMVIFILFVVLFVFERSERPVSQAFHDMPLFPDERTPPSFPAVEPELPGASSLAEESRTAVRATGSPASGSSNARTAASRSARAARCSSIWARPT